MNVVPLSPFDLALAGLLVVFLALVSLPLKLGIARALVWAALRAVIQLSLLGLVLKTIFAGDNPIWTGLAAALMLAVAVVEVRSRQQRPLAGASGYRISALTLFLTSFSVCWLSVFVIIDVEPWYTPQYVLPLLGMLLGNTMTGVAISLDRLTQDVWNRRGEIEARLALGHDWRAAVSGIRAQSLRTGLIPAISGMATAGIVALPGMMTGQILSGTEPFLAAQYQVLILFLIAGSNGFGAIIAVLMTSRHLFDSRQRLCLQRLSGQK